MAFGKIGADLWKRPMLGGQSFGEMLKFDASFL
jgi:hypothetical protein